MPSAFGLASSFCTIRLSFSPASTYEPSSRMESQIFLKRASSTSFTDLIQGKVEQPFSSTSSAKASRVPEVGGGPSTSILFAGKDLLMSLQFLYGLAISAVGLAGSGTCLASARNSSRREILNRLLLLELANTMP